MFFFIFLQNKQNNDAISADYIDLSFGPTGYFLISLGTLLTPRMTVNLSLPFNPTSKRLKGNRSQWPLKAGHIHASPQNQSCKIMFVL